MHDKKGLLILVSAPSGGGKNAIIRALLERFSSSTQLVTTTTREKRPGEEEGKDYYYISKEAFEEKKEAGGFVEYNMYAGNYYGTAWDHLEAALSAYAIVFSQAEVNGKKSLDAKGIPHVSIFLLPEHIDILRARIVARGGTSPASLEERIETAQKEIAEASIYDLPILNKDGYMQETVEAIVAFLCKEHGLQRYLDNES
ncbi:MAG: guanylate kinase [Candidatus Magasanikbacteria bacterium]|nr:guanylate kinase [Candidatus Magasanikbacteria bacterium]